MRKGEYTPAVDDWLTVMRAKHPNYLVVVRSVNLSRERGETEKLKVGSVIYRELMIAAAQAGVVLGAPVNIGPGPYAGQNQSPSVTRMPAPDRRFLNPNPTRYPVNVYPRPDPYAVTSQIGDEVAMAANAGDNKVHQPCGPGSSAAPPIATSSSGNRRCPGTIVV